MYKNVGVLVIVGLLAVVVQGSDNYDDKEGAHSIARGTRKIVDNKTVDSLLYHDDIKADGSLFPFPTVQSHDFCYPPKKSPHAKLVITAFNIEDAGKGGVAYMKKKDAGGVGKNKVCFHLKSSRGRGYHFIVKIYGYYK